MGWYHSEGFQGFDDDGPSADATTTTTTTAAPTASTPNSSGNTACPLPANEGPPPPPPDVDSIYHLCLLANWKKAVVKREPYFPPTFVEDGKFTRATIYKTDLVDTANEFYKKTPGDWICLEINCRLLYSMGIPILAQIAPESIKKMEPVKCLQVYGGISTTLPGLVSKIYSMTRASNGKFLDIVESKLPTSANCGCPSQANRQESPTKGKENGKANGSNEKKKKSSSSPPKEQPKDVEGKTSKTSKSSFAFWKKSKA